jgi:hypothetical protein
MKGMVHGILIPDLSRRIARACRKDGATASVVRSVIEERFEELALGVPTFPRDWKPDGRVLWQGPVHASEHVVIVLRRKPEASK